MVGTALAAVGAALAVVVIAAAAGAASVFGGLNASGLATAGAAPSRRALADIPAPMLALYQRAAPECPGLPWTVLAAIGKIETDHGRHPTMTSPAGAVGPMQFLPATFAAYDQPVPPGGTKPPTPWDPVNAVHAAARLLCDHGAPDDLERAVWHYNHSHAYVRDILAQAARYTATDAAPSPQATAVLAYAHAQIGQPYVWGGDGPGDGGFDCSGLTRAAYAAAGIRLPRIAHDQYHAGPRLAPGEPLLPGDLVFYGTPGNVHHVGLYTGNSTMIHAPQPGARITQNPYRWAGDDYLGATRPWHQPHQAGQ